MAMFRVRIERLVQEVAWVVVDAESPDDAVTEAIAKDDLEFSGDMEACPPYAYSVTHEASGFEYSLVEARADGAKVGQQAQGAGLETLPPGSLMAEWERKLLDERIPDSSSAETSKGL